MRAKGKQRLRDALGRFRKRGAPPPVPAAPAPVPTPPGTAPPEWDAGIMRTDMQCTECLKHFIARLDATITAEQVVRCPHCNHPHWRQIVNGQVTETRWGFNLRDDNAVLAKAEVVAKEVPVTTTAAGFLRERWLNFGG